MQFVNLIGDKQFIAMDDIALSYYFILLEVSFGQCAIYVVNVVLSLKIAVLHVAVLADRWKTAVLVVLFDQVRLE